MKYESTVEGKTFKLAIDPDNGRMTIDGKAQPFEFLKQNGRYLLRIDTHLYKIDNVEFNKRTVTFTLNGRWYEVDVRDEQELLLDEMGFKSAHEVGEGQLNAPMPGKILELMVKEGDAVEEDQPVAILEAMKMENELKAPAGGTVKAIHIEVGESVEKNALILEIEASG